MHATAARTYGLEDRRALRRALEASELGDTANTLGEHRVERGAPSARVEQQRAVEVEQAEDGHVRRGWHSVS